MQRTFSSLYVVSGFSRTLTWSAVASTKVDGGYYVHWQLLCALRDLCGGALRGVELSDHQSKAEKEQQVDACPLHDAELRAQAHGVRGRIGEGRSNPEQPR